MSLQAGQIGEPSIDVFNLLNQAMAGLKQGQSEDIKSSRITAQSHKKIMEDKHEERLHKIQDNLHRLGKGKCLRFLNIITKVGALVTAPLTGGASLIPTMLSLASTLLQGLHQLQQAKNQKGYILSKTDQEMLARVIEEVHKMFDEELSHISTQGEQGQRELQQMQKAIEQATEGFQTTQ